MTPYSRTRIWLHWMVIVLLLIQWMSADGMGRALAVLERDETPGAWDFVLTNLHLFCGGLVLLLTLWRLRIRQGASSPVAVGPRILHQVASVTHWAILGVLLALPITGVLSYYQLLPAAGRLHEWAGWMLGGLILLHLLGLIWHGLLGHMIWRRMVTIGLKSTESDASDAPLD